MPLKTDPEANRELRRRDTQQTMRQFLKLESGLGNSKAFVENWETIFRTPDVVLSPALRCSSKGCTYIAETRKEAAWHIKQCPGHAFWLPGRNK